MAYSNFTLEAVRTAFQLEIVESAGIFSEIASMDPSEHLATALDRTVRQNPRYPLKHGGSKGMRKKFAINM